MERLRPVLRTWIANWEETREESWMAADRSTAELEEFLAERADHLLRTAVLLAGGREAGEDLLLLIPGGPLPKAAARPSPAGGPCQFNTAHPVPFRSPLALGRPADLCFVTRLPRLSGLC
jgi:hypothetical protein